MGIEENVKRIFEEVTKINKDVEIVAATKTRTIEEIRTCINTGLVVAAGENKVQELLSKYVDDFKWDFIGQLQTNKVKYIIDKVRLIQSLDRESLAQTIEKECIKHSKIQECLIEINTGSEESKGGIELSELDNYIDIFAKYEHIKIAGLMAVAPAELTEEELKRLFDGVYNEFSKRKNAQFRYLSMGMSNDYLTAVKSGANIIRPGRSIFGARIYPTNI